MTLSKKRSLLVAVIVASISLPAVLGALAQAATAVPNGYVVTKVNQRAGPRTDFPVVTLVPASASVTVHGCIKTYSWCDVGYKNGRGWMLANYLRIYYQNRYLPIREYATRAKLPVVAFDVKSYWAKFYKNRPFYAQLARWSVPRAPAIAASTFYRPLSEHGSWVWLRGQYVWVPARVDADWRPYTVGHWAYTDRYGWFWVSDEPFGWATYHYGRWGFSHQIGWFWIPGTRWAPAWVSWRESDDYLAWAPLPPARDDSISIEISIGFIPDYYWQVVPSSAFLSLDVSQEIIRDDGRFVPVLAETRPAGNVTIINNVVVNNVINVQYVEQKTQEIVVVHDVVATTNSDQPGRTEGRTIEVFTPAPTQDAQTAATDAPPDVKKIEELAAASQTNEQAGDQPATEEMVVAPPPAPANPDVGTGEQVVLPAAQEAPTEPAPPVDETPAPEAVAPPEPPSPAEEVVPFAVEAPPPEAVPAESAPIVEAPVPEAIAPADSLAPIDQLAPPAAQEAPAEPAPPVDETPAPEAIAPEPPPPADQVAPPAVEAAPVETVPAPPVVESPQPEPSAPADSLPVEQVPPAVETPPAEVVPAKPPVDQNGVPCLEGADLLEDGTCLAPTK